MSSSQMLKGKRKMGNTILSSHPSLSIEQETQFITHKDRQQTIEQNLRNIENIKRLVTELASREREEHELKLKLHRLNNDLSQEEYIELRQRIEQQAMTTEDKLSRLNELYYQKKEERDRKKMGKRMDGKDAFVMGKEEIEAALKKKRDELVYGGEEMNVEEIQPVKVKVSGRRN